MDRNIITKEDFLSAIATVDPDRKDPNIQDVGMFITRMNTTYQEASLKDMLIHTLRSLIDIRKLHIDSLIMQPPKPTFVDIDINKIDPESPVGKQLIELLLKK